MAPSVPADVTIFPKRKQKKEEGDGSQGADATGMHHPSHPLSTPLGGGALALPVHPCWSSTGSPLSLALDKAPERSSVGMALLPLVVLCGVQGTLCTRLGRPWWGPSTPSASLGTLCQSLWGA